MLAHPYKVHVAAAMLLLLGNTGTHGTLPGYWRMSFEFWIYFQLCFCPYSVQCTCKIAFLFWQMSGCRTRTSYMQGLNMLTKLYILVSCQLGSHVVWGGIIVCIINVEVGPVLWLGAHFESWRARFQEHLNHHFLIFRTSSLVKYQTYDLWLMYATICYIYYVLYYIPGTCEYPLFLGLQPSKTSLFPMKRRVGRV